MCKFLLISIDFIFDESGAGNFCLIHVSLVPVVNVVGEQVSLLGLVCLLM